MAHRSFRSPRALPCGEHRVDGCEVGRGSAVLRGRLAVGLCDQRTWASPQCIAGHTCCPLGPTVVGKLAILLPNNPIPNGTLVSILLSRSRNPSRLVDLGGGFVSRDWKGVCPQHKGVPIITSTVGQTGGSGREFKCPPRRSTSSHEEWGGAGVAALLMHDPTGGPRRRAPRRHGHQACGAALASPLTAPCPPRLNTYCLPWSPDGPSCTHAALHKHDGTAQTGTAGAYLSHPPRG